MMRYFVAFLGAFLIVLACSDNPETPGGTLPVVQNCRILFESCRGDTVVIAWDSLDVEVDNYRVWFADTDPGNWSVVATTPATVTEDIALSTGYYCVDAVRGDDESSDQSDKADNIAIVFGGEGDTLSFETQCGLAFGDSAIVFGDPSDPGFAQDVVLTDRLGGGFTAFSGDFDPGIYPGGSASLLAPVEGKVAPHPDSSAWVEELDLAGSPHSAFVRLDSGYYAYFLVSTLTDTTYQFLTAQLHAWPGIRLFNWLTL
ncbi:hypothetical protein JW921_06995 [Candidatus Fermentibacterales bacterium]|nr:hypothetical protein [Candidatus Fermentibacterales bacterium]